MQGTELKHPRWNQIHLRIFLRSTSQPLNPYRNKYHVPSLISSTLEVNLPQERKEYATKLKAAGNIAYGDKSYNDAIDLYGKAIICKPDPIFYSNRAACYNALGDWEKVVEDTSAAIALDSEYVKALNRRANAYEHLEKYSEALLDYTASCIIDQFRNELSAQSVERLLKKVAEAKGRLILEGKERKLPSPSFVTNYLQSFRPRPPPEGLEETADLDEDSGKGQLRAGLLAIAKKTGEGYENASVAFDKALELRDLGDHEALAYNMRGTFRYLRGENADALKDLTRSVELQPALSQSFIKRASMHLELGKTVIDFRIFSITDMMQETEKRLRMISNKLCNKRTTIPISITTERSSTSYLGNSEKQPKITKDPSTSIKISSSPTFS